MSQQTQLGSETTQSGHPQLPLTGWKEGLGEPLGVQPLQWLGGERLVGKGPRSAFSISVC